MPEERTYKCLACRDKGTEQYRAKNDFNEKHRFDCRCSYCIYVRPCRHCDAGDRALAAWRGKEGPWYGTDPNRIAIIMGYQCAHDPLPVRPANTPDVQTPVMGPVGTIPPQGGEVLGG